MAASNYSRMMKRRRQRGFKDAFNRDHFADDLELIRKEVMDGDNIG